MWEAAVLVAASRHPRGAAVFPAARYAVARLPVPNNVRLPLDESRKARVGGMTEPLRVHPFRYSRYRDYRQRPICDECGSTQDATVHRLLERDEDEREVEARRMGEET